jgi:hypothetical protein
MAAVLLPLGSIRGKPKAVKITLVVFTVSIKLLANGQMGKLANGLPENVDIMVIFLQLMELCVFEDVIVIYSECFNRHRQLLLKAFDFH